MSEIVYIGVDDTDVLGSPGTGKIARGIAEMLFEKGLAKSLGVSRHQLLVDPRVKYTSHNSCKGIAVITDNFPVVLVKPCSDYIKDHFQPGSDPGLCICSEKNITPEILAYSVKAETEFIQKDEAYTLVSGKDIFLTELGGDGGGVIGALAAVGLRAGGNNGRLVDIRGVRDISGKISVMEIKFRTDIVAVSDIDGNELSNLEIVESLSWIRPNLVNGKPVLKVILSEELTNVEGKRIWIPAEREMKMTKGDKNE
ncbi:MAG: hypothetical protein HQM10_06010 [Candidatus Riflebacteria bacterium]|nr:hypothetical protein [Candidatus Riflebacteria bacterium]